MLWLKLWVGRRYVKTMKRQNNLELRDSRVSTVLNTGVRQVKSGWMTSLDFQWEREDLASQMELIFREGYWPFSSRARLPKVHLGGELVPHCWCPCERYFP